MSERHEMKTESTYTYRPPTFDEGTVSHGQVHTLPRIQEPTQRKRYAPPTFSDDARYAPPAFDDAPRYTPPAQRLYTPPAFDQMHAVKRPLQTSDPVIDAQIIEAEPLEEEKEALPEVPEEAPPRRHKKEKRIREKKSPRRTKREKADKADSSAAEAPRQRKREKSPAMRWLSITALVCAIVFFSAATVRILFLPTDETVYVFDGTQAEYIITDDYIPPATMPVISNVSWDGSDALALLETSTLIGAGDAILLEQAATSGATNLSCTVRVYMTCTGTVEEMDLEEYLVGVVAAEVPASYNMEAIKAQAVAARTYTVRRMANLGGSGDGRGGDVCTSPAHCQAYYSQEDLQKRWGRNFEKYYRIICEAVFSTRGLVLTYDGKPINAFYHASSGGRTANCEDVFTQALPYLRAVDSPGESAYSGFSTTKTLSRSEFASVLSNKTGTTIAPEELESVVEVTDRRDGRIYRIKIAGETYKGTTFQSWFSLRTTNIQISMDAENVTMTVYGYGHGVGMSQTGANAMAGAGNSYATILKHYYTGVELEPYM